MNDLIQRLREGEFEMNPLLLMDEAADALEKQQAEIERLKGAHLHRDQMKALDDAAFIAIVVELETLKAQAAKDAADAGRYRFLEYQCNTGEYRGIISRNAIDAAMKESQQ